MWYIGTSNKEPISLSPLASSAVSYKICEFSFNKNIPLKDESITIWRHFNSSQSTTCPRLFTIILVCQWFKISPEKQFLENICYLSTVFVRSIQERYVRPPILNPRGTWRVLVTTRQAQGLRGDVWILPAWWRWLYFPPAGSLLDLSVMTRLCVRQIWVVEVRPSPSPPHSERLECEEDHQSLL